MMKVLCCSVVNNKATDRWGVDNKNFVVVYVPGVETQLYQGSCVCDSIDSRWLLLSFGERAYVLLRESVAESKCEQLVQLPAACINSLEHQQFQVSVGVQCDNYLFLISPSVCVCACWSRTETCQGNYYNYLCSIIILGNQILVHTRESNIGTMGEAIYHSSLLIINFA